MERREATTPNLAPRWPESDAVSKWMSGSVVTIASEAPVRAAVELMRSRSIRHLPVVDGGGRLVGIVTDRDLRQVVFDAALRDQLGAMEAADEVPVREVMTWTVVSVSPTTSIRAAARIMHERKIGAVPVVEDHRPVGMLTEHDILRAFEDLARQHLRTVRPLAADRAAPSEYDYGFARPSDEPSEGQ